MTNTHGITPLKDLNLTDRFLFDEAMQDKETHQAALSIIFSKEIALLPENEVEKQLQTAPYLKSVRLDVFAMDDDDVIYNTEMQKSRKTDLKRRSRFYQALIDSSLLPAGSINYNQLQDSYIVMITPFDIFGLEKYQYTFQSECIEAPTLFLNDGATRIFLNTKGKNKEDVSEELVEFLEYLEDTTDATAACVNSKLIKKIHERVSAIKSSEEIGVRYMQLWEEKAYERAEARAEGRAEGREYALIEMIQKKAAKNLDAAAIAEFLEEPEEFVEKVCSCIRENPAASVDELAALLNEVK